MRPQNKTSLEDSMPCTFREAQNKLRTLRTVYTETERAIYIYTRQLNMYQIDETAYLEDTSNFNTLIEKLHKYEETLKRYERKIEKLHANHKNMNDVLLQEIWNLKAVKFEPTVSVAAETLGYLAEYDINDLCFPCRNHTAVERRVTGPHSSQKIELHPEKLSASPSAPNLLAASSGFVSLGSQISLVSETDVLSRRDLRLERNRYDSDVVQSSHKLLWSARVNAEYKANKMKDIGFPEDVAFLPGGRVVASDSAFNKLQLYNEDGKPIRALGQHKLTQILGDWKFQPQCIAVSHSDVYATDLKNKCIKQFNPDSGRCTGSISLLNYSRPYGLDILPDGKFVVTHCDDFITIHDVTGRTLKTIHSDGNFWYVCCDKRNRIITSDCSNHCVKIFDTTGKLLQTFGQDSVENAQLSYPHGVCVDRTGHIFVADSLNNRVCQFTSSGLFMGDVVSDRDCIQCPRGLAIDGDKLAVTWQGGVSVWETPMSASSHFLSTYL